MYGRFANPEPRRGGADGGSIFYDILRQAHRPKLDTGIHKHHSKP